MNPSSFILERDAVMRSYTADVAAYCAPFLAKTATSTSSFQKMRFSTKKNCLERPTLGLTPQTHRRF